MNYIKHIIIFLYIFNNRKLNETSIILQFIFLFFQTIFSYEINVLKTDFQDYNTTLSDNTLSLMNDYSKDIISFEVKENSITLKFNSDMKDELVQVFDLIDDEVIKCINENEIKVNLS